MPRYCYRAFGLLISSELPLAGALEEVRDGGTPDVVVRLAAGLPLSGERLDWEGCSLLVSGGREIWAELHVGADMTDASLAVSGAGLGLLLTQRSFLVLHGSCVALGGRALCLLGPSGAGKSTLAAALVGRGYRLISDAMTVLSEVDGAWVALPGWSTLKLWPASVSHLGWQASVLGNVHASSEKLMCSSGQSVLGEAGVRVACVASVSAQAPVDLGLVRPADSVIDVLKNHYLADLGKLELGQAALAQCSGLLRAADFRRVARGQKLDELEDAIQRLDEWFRST